MEIWKEIEGFEGLYEISSFGRVKSLSRRYKGGYGKDRLKKERILKSVSYLGTYLCVCLRKDNKNHHSRVHQLVAAAFLNHKAQGHKIVIDHINNNKFNNRVENLQIITQRENGTKDRVSNSGINRVSFHKATGKFMAYYHVNGKQVYLGVFKCKYEAHKVVEKALSLL